MDTRGLCFLALLCLAALAKDGSAQELASHARELRNIAQWSEADQTAWLFSMLDRGMPPNDYYSVLLRTHSDLAVSIIEKKIEQVLKSDSPATCFSERTVDPKLFVAEAAGEIAYAADENAFRATSRLMKIDEQRFGRFVESTLGYAYSSSARRNPLTVAYGGLDLGDPAVDRRIIEWIEPLFIRWSANTAALHKRMWAEALVERYGAPPTETEWANDPIASRLRHPQAATLHDEMIRLAADALQKRHGK
jgi:hypothetical protein